MQKLGLKLHPLPTGAGSIALTRLCFIISIDLGADLTQAFLTEITTDTTEFKYYEIDNKGHMAIRKLYLDPFMDLYNREIISFNIAKQPNAQGIMAALNAAIEVTSDCGTEGHSLRPGMGIPDEVLCRRIKQSQDIQSMSRKDAVMIIL